MPRTAGVSGRSRVWFSFRKPSEATVAFMSSEYPMALFRQVALIGRAPPSPVMTASPRRPAAPPRAAPRAARAPVPQAARPPQRARAQGPERLVLAVLPGLPVLPVLAWLAR